MVTENSDPRYWPQLVAQLIRQGQAVEKLDGSRFSPYRRARTPKQELVVEISGRRPDRIEVLLSKQTTSSVSSDVCVGMPRLESRNTRAHDMVSGGHLIPLGAPLESGRLSSVELGSNDIGRKFLSDTYTACRRAGAPSVRSTVDDIRYRSDLMEDAAYLFRVTKDVTLSDCSYVQAGYIAKGWRNIPGPDLPHAHLLRAFVLADGWLEGVLSGEQHKKLRREIRDVVALIVEASTRPDAWWDDEYASNYKHAFVGALGVACQRFVLPSFPDCQRRLIEEMRTILDALPDDGSSLEGPGYWNYSLIWLVGHLRVLNEVDRSELTADSQFLRNASTFRLHISVPGFAEVIPYGDSDPREYDRAGTALRGLSSIQVDPVASELARRVTRARWESVDLTWRDVAWQSVASSKDSISTQPRYRHLVDQGIVIWRSSWTSDDAELVMFKAGALQGQKLRSRGVAFGGHNHPDQGAVLLFADRQWVLRDDGYSSRKLTSTHNSMLFGGVGQLGEGGAWFDAKKIEPGPIPQLTVRSLGPEGLSLEADLESAYPVTAGIARWKRRISWERNGPLVIVDHIERRAKGEVTWTYHTQAGVELTRRGACVGNAWRMTLPQSIGTGGQLASILWEAAVNRIVGVVLLPTREEFVVETRLDRVASGCQG